MTASARSRLSLHWGAFALDKHSYGIGVPLNALASVGVHYGSQSYPVIYTPFEGSYHWGFLRDGTGVAIVSPADAVDYIMNWKPGLGGWLKEHAITVNDNGWKPTSLRKETAHERMIGLISSRSAWLESGTPPAEGDPLQGVPVDF